MLSAIELSHPPAQRVVELFAGLGGVSAAWPEADVVAAVDIDQHAESVFTLNHAAAFYRRELLSVQSAEFSKWDCQAVWLSPPCQPFTVRGAQRGMSDRRSAALRHIIGVLAKIRPQTIILENVPGFCPSDGFSFVTETLDSAGYNITHRLLCPTQLGWPNRRERFYLIAHLGGALSWRELPRVHREATGESLLGFSLASHSEDPSVLRLGDFLDTAVDSELWMAEAEQSRYLAGLDIVDRTGNSASKPAACFGSSYGRAISRSGSYLLDGGRLRRFSPREVARLLGFSDALRLPLALSNRQLWKILGNSLSLPAVRYVLGHVPP